MSTHQIKGEAAVFLPSGEIDWKQLAEARGDEIDRLRKALELIAGSSADKLQALQARSALDNIGPRA